MTSRRKTSSKNTEADIQSRIREKERKLRKKHGKTYIGRVLDQENRPNPFIMAIEFILAYVLDILKLLKNLILWILGLGLMGTAIVGLVVFVKIEPYYNQYSKDAKEMVENSTADTFRISESSYIYDKDGQLLIKLKADKDSNYIFYDDIPNEVVDAFIAIEDRSFWENPGVDLKGIIRVGYNFIKSDGEEAHGASTITQQLARNIFLTHEVSLERKAKEMLLALDMTQKYTKREIMEFYINDICYANAYYGIEAAAKGYFNKSVKDLSLSQIAYLCAIPNSPSYYDPYKNPERAITRRDKILKDMLSLNYISEDDYNLAIAEEITIEKPSYDFHNYQSTYAINCATEYLMKLDGFEFKYVFDTNADYSNYLKDYSSAYNDAKNELYNGGYRVYTTLDSNAQVEMQHILDDTLSFSTTTGEDSGVFELQGAMTVVDNSTGKVIAVIGGRTQTEDSKTYSLNRAFQSPRQPGSSIKPLIDYTPALEHGFTPDSIVKNIDVTEAKKKGADVDKIGGQAMTLRSALEQSKNGVAWYIFSKLTPKVGLKYITDMEFSTIVPDDYYGSSSLGGFTHGVTTVEMATAYSTLENHGAYRGTTCIDKILDKNGNDIYREQDEKQVYKKQSADTMIDMMKGVLTNGTARKLDWYKSTKVEAACKTGTTNDNKDGWLCGVTPYYSIAVWVGYDTPRTLSSLYGSTYPGEMWKNAMLKMLELNNYTEGQFEFSEDTSSDNVTDDMIQGGYYSYLPGRDDSELLSSGYTVANYRTDRVIGESVTIKINEMTQLDFNSDTYLLDLETKKQEAETIISTIYSRKYTSEMQQKLNSAYNECLNKYNNRSADHSGTIYDVTGQ